MKFGPAINFIKKAIPRELFGINVTEVHRFKLSRKDLFSSRVSDSVLVITRDFKLKGVTDQQVKTAQCSLLALQNRIRQKNTTEFMTVIFPDKTTVYSDYLLDRSYANMSIVKTLENTKGLNIVKLVDEFKDSVTKGMIDFYLPNDTHCGYVAYKMAADATLSRLDDLLAKSSL